MRILFIFLVALTICAELAYAQSVNVNVVRMNPTTMPSTCVTGDLRVDSADSFSLKVCRSNVWHEFAEVLTSMQDPMTTDGDLIIQAAGVPSRLAVGSANTVLTANGTAPSWQTNFTAGTITAALVGNSSTATALAGNPADCGADTYATTIAASGDLTCATVTNAGLAGSIAASKLIGSDIATVGTITSGTWNGSTIAINRGGTGQTTAQAALDALLPAQTGLSGYSLTTNGTASSWDDMTGSSQLANFGLATSVGSSALTIAVKSKAGSDPSSTSRVLVGFRNATVATGQYSQVAISGALSVVVSSGSTLGHGSAVNEYIYVYLINNAGTAELAVSSDVYDDGDLVSTTAEGGAGAADSSGAIYSTTARANVPVRLVGRILSNQATAGTWNTTPARIALLPFEKIYITDYYDYTGAGHGSTNTKIRRIETSGRARGKDVTRAISAANGNSYTINTTGIYSVQYQDSANSAPTYAGVSLNSSTLTTEVYNLTAAENTIYAEQNTNGRFVTMTHVGMFNAGDVLRPHTDGVPNSTNTKVTFRIKRIN